MSDERDEKRARWAKESGEEQGNATRLWFSAKESPAEPERPEPSEPSAPPTYDDGAASVSLGVLSRWQRALAALVMGTGFVSWMLPALIVLWGLVGLLVVGAAVLMERELFEQAEQAGSTSLITIHTLFATALLGIPTITIAVLKERRLWPTRWPTSLSVVVAGFGYFGAMGLFYLADGNFPDFLFEVILECVAWAWMMFLPWFALRCVYLGGRRLWRWMGTHPFWSGSLVGLTGTLTCVAVSVWFIFGAGLWTLLRQNTQQIEEVASTPAPMAIMSALANSSPPTPFQSCVETLVSSPSQFTTSRTWREAAIDRLVSNRTPRDAAEDVAQDALIRVCVRHSRQHIDDVGPYYMTSVDNLSRSQWRRYRREERCPNIEVVADDYYRVLPATSHEELMHLARQMCKLSQEDQELLQLYAEGHTAREIAQRLNIQPAAVRKRIERAVEELRTLYFAQ
jgi:RNA polymerase sigma factor (sigma-70 family)